MWKFKTERASLTGFHVLAWESNSDSEAYNIPVLVGIVATHGGRFIPDLDGQELGNFPTLQAAAQFLVRYWVGEQEEDE